MESKILVTYASLSGSTQEIAEVVAYILRSQGLEVDLQPMKNVQKLDDYTAVVMGASIYMFHWQKEMHHFLSKYQKALNRLPVALFTGGPTMTGDEKEWQAVRSQVDQELAKFPWLKPVSVEIVGGKFDSSKLKFPYNLIPALKNKPATDLRDWEEIKSWGRSLVEKLNTVQNERTY